jgi:hypothetical protein
MALFLVRHQHPAQGCPAQDPYKGAMLLNYLSRSSVRQHGVQVHGEAVVQGEHTLYLIIEAADEVHLRAFLQPFQMAGSVDIYPASTCAPVPPTWLAVLSQSAPSGTAWVKAIMPSSRCRLG